MKRFVIIDMVSNRAINIFCAQNGKSALNKFKRCLMNSGMYEFRKEDNTWIMCSTYGAYFKAIETEA